MKIWGSIQEELRQYVHQLYSILSAMIYTVSIIVLKIVECLFCSLNRAINVVYDVYPKLVTHGGSGKTLICVSKCH